MSAASDGREVTIVFGLETASGLKGGVTEQNEWQIQGYKEDYQISVWIDADAFENTPESSDSITVDGTVKRVLGVHPDSIGALIRLDLGGRYGRP
jgi:hypothetical protein